MCSGSSTPETPGSFAREILHTEVIASRYLADTSQDEHVVAHYEQTSVEEGYGGWPEYQEGEIRSRQPLKETEYTGRRADSMSKQKVIVDGETVGAFVTEYSGEEPQLRQAHSQMAVWAFCDAIGLNVPRHHWFPEEEIVVVEEVGGPNEEVEDPMSLESQRADHISPDGLLDIISVQLLAGTADLLPKNFKIGEEGQIYVFDFDKSDQEFRSVAALETACTKAMKTIGVLNTARDEDLAIGRNDICSRVQKIATDIDNTSHKDRILSTVRLYDRLFEDITEESFEDQFRNNITVFSDDY